MIKKVRLIEGPLQAYLGKSIDELTLTGVADAKAGFRAFLRERHYRKNAIHVKVDSVRLLLKYAGERRARPEAGREFQDLVGGGGIPHGSFTRRVIERP